jgi:hypothetical protein
MTALETFGELKMLPVAFLQRRGLSDEPGGGIRVNYGDNCRPRVRKNPQSAHPTFWANGDTRPMRAFGHELAAKMASGQHKTLLIVEGESDTLTAWHHRWPCLGVPGATMGHTIERADVDWAERVGIVREPGDAGAKFVQAVAKRLRALGFTGEIVEITVHPHKDLSALHIAVNAERDAFSTALEAALAAATPVAAEVAPSSEPSLLSAADLLNSQGESVEYLIDGLLPRGGIMLLVGKPKCGKSVLARNLALAACRGSSFLGRDTEKTTVLWLCLEESRSQVSAAFRAMGLRADDAIQFFFGHADRDAQAWLERTCEQVNAGLVVIDTWHKLTLIESVNDYGAVNRANQRLQQLARERGVAQVWIHHSNKGIARNGSEVLGSQALFAAVDTLMSMDRSEDGTRSVWTIQRSGDDLEPTVVTMNDDEQIAIAGTRREVEIRRAQRRILDTVGATPIGGNELREAAEVRRGSFWPALNGLVRDQRVTRIGEGKRLDPYLYCAGDENVASDEVSSPASFTSYKGPAKPETLSSPHSSGTSSGPPGTSGTNGTSKTSGTTGEDPDLLMRYADERGLI